jgi:hypothetical protein
LNLAFIRIVYPLLLLAGGITRHHLHQGAWTISCPCIKADPRATPDLFLGLVVNPKHLFILFIACPDMDGAASFPRLSGVEAQPVTTLEKTCPWIAKAVLQHCNRPEVPVFVNATKLDHFPIYACHCDGEKCEH